MMIWPTSSPRSDHTHEVILQMARYENIFLNEQFVNGSDGTKWELDDVTVATAPSPSPEGLKSGTEVNQLADIGVNSAMVRQQGANPEFYRGHLLIKSNRANDDFQSIAELAQAIHQDGDALFEATNQIMDVDLWMRHYANQSYFGNWDTYGFGRPKNLRIYLRPEDHKFVPLFWDCDLCNFTEPIKKRTEATSRLDEIRDIPHNLRLYWGHMLDFMNRSFTEEYVQTWADHYGELVNNQTYGGDETFTGIAASTAARNRQAMSDLLRDIPQVDFEITTNGGQDITIDTPTITLEGKGWVDIRYMRLAETGQQLDVFWPETDGWRIELPLSTPNETFTLEAIGYQGQLVASDSITVSTSAVDPVMQSLRISEVQYHPADPTAFEIAGGFTDADDFEYIELTNIGGEVIPLAGVAFVSTGEGNAEQGVQFNLADGSVTELAPGQSIVVVEDLAAFRARYGQDPLVAGQWSGGLGNASEQITLTSDGIILHQFTYQDSWHPTTDGTGRSLQTLSVDTPDLSAWNTPQGWRPSSLLLGSPGTNEPVVGDANGDGIFDSADLVVAMGAGEYEDSVTGNSTYAEGDFNGDGDFDTSDLVWTFTYGNYTAAAIGIRAAQPVDARISSAVNQTQSMVATAQEQADERSYHQPIATPQPTLLPAPQVDSLFVDSEVDSLSATPDAHDKAMALLEDDNLLDSI